MTWPKAASNPEVGTVQDPLLDTHLTVAQFQAAYGPFLATLDGGDMSAYFDFYFERSPICDTHWVFKDEDLRADFCDGARDEKCMPSLQEVHEGEDTEAKVRRQGTEAAADASAQAEAAQKAKLTERKKRSAVAAPLKMREQLLKTLEMIDERLSRADLSSEDERRLVQKKDRVKASLAAT